MRPRAQRSGHRFVYRPSAQKPPLQCARLESEMAFPVGHGSTCVVEFNEVIRPRVIRLDNRFCPPTIAGFVVAVYINAINRMSDRARPHIFEECFKTFAPALAHVNVATSIIWVASLILVIAACFCRSPRHILPRGWLILATRARLSVRAKPIGRLIALQASATSRVAGSEFPAFDINHAPTFAATTPCGACIESWVSPCAPDDRQASKGLAVMIDGFRKHQAILLWSVFVGGVLRP